MIDAQRAPAHLPEGILPTDRVLSDGTVIHSLTAHALAEIGRHRWIESERAHADLGHHADEHWLAHCWRGWVRARLLEHLYGWRCWSAFALGQFGLLQRGTVEREVPGEVLDKVASILAGGGENLDVIGWAVEEERDLPPILWLLDRIDINSARRRLLEDHIRLFLPEPGTAVVRRRDPHSKP